MKKIAHFLVTVALIMLASISSAIVVYVVFRLCCEFLGKSNDLSFIQKEIIISVLAVLQSVVIAIFVKGELKNHEKLTKKSLALESKGIKDVNKTGMLSNNELKDLFFKADTIKMMFVTGINFFNNNRAIIEESLKRGKKIRVLLATPNSEFVNEIAEQLDGLGSHENDKTNNQNQEIEEVIKMVNELRAKKLGDIEVRHFNTEYRVPFYIGYYDNEKRIKAWYNSVLPVAAPSEMIMFYGEADAADRAKYYKQVKRCAEVLCDKSCEESKEILCPNCKLCKDLDIYSKVSRVPFKQNIIFDLEAHFDYLWYKVRSRPL